jgi:hypothetical protein
VIVKVRRECETGVRCYVLGGMSTWRVKVERKMEEVEEVEEVEEDVQDEVVENNSTSPTFRGTGV